MAANHGQVWGVLIADIAGSSKIPDLRQLRDRALTSLSRRHLDEERILVRYTVTAWDEFQSVLAKPWEVPKVIWDLRLAFHPIELRIGVGLGTIEELPGPDSPVNEVSSGEAFLRAREAVSRLGTEGRKYALRTMLRTDDDELNRTLNLLYMLMDTLLSGLSERQWETIRAYQETGRQDQAAAQLHVKSESTVSRNLQRGHYWQLVDARSELRELLRTRFAR